MGPRDPRIIVHTHYTHTHIITHARTHIGQRHTHTQSPLLTLTHTHTHKQTHTISPSHANTHTHTHTIHSQIHDINMLTTKQFYPLSDANIKTMTYINTRTTHTL